MTYTKGSKFKVDFQGIDSQQSRFIARKVDSKVDITRVNNLRYKPF